MQDMTLRSLETLKTVDLIAAEDTRNTQKLLNHFEIKVPQESFHEYNSFEKKFRNCLPFWNLASPLHKFQMQECLQFRILDMI